MCMQASRNARALEEVMLNVNDVISLTDAEAAEIVNRCEQIIRCMKECFDT
mgnify:CR=1 FL=1